MRDVGLWTLDFGLWTSLAFRTVDDDGSKLPGQLQPRGEQVGGQNAHSVQGQQAGEHQADGALAGYEDGFAAQQVEAFDGFEDRVDWFEHGAFKKRIARWDSDHARQDKMHDPHVFGITATRRLEARP